MQPKDDVPNLQGQRIARGSSRLLHSYNFRSLLEFVPKRGLRTDVFAIGPKGQIWIVECKSCVADFTSDAKWQNYLEWCDQFFWAVDTEFPIDILPEGYGLIIADAYGGELLHEGQENRLSPARRKALTLSFARQAAKRLHALSG